MTPVTSSAPPPAPNPLLDLAMSATLAPFVYAAIELTPLGATLRRDAPGFVRSIYRLTMEPSTWSALGNATASIRTGEPAIDRLFGKSVFDVWRDDPHAFAIATSSNQSRRVATPTCCRRLFNAIANAWNESGSPLRCDDRSSHAGAQPRWPRADRGRVRLFAYWRRFRNDANRSNRLAFQHH